MNSYERIVAVRVIKPYVLELTFEHGMVREIDIEPRMRGPIFEPLRDPEFFAKVRIDETFGCIEWPNGADLAPESLLTAGTLIRGPREAAGRGRA